VGDFLCPKIVEKIFANKLLFVLQTVLELYYTETPRKGNKMNITAIAKQIKADCNKFYPGVKFSVRQVASSTDYIIDVLFSENIDRRAVESVVSYYSKLYNVYVSASQVRA
jgi:adenine C2-methylase RlmN of 23S rRNA A2503 and tRNA A37